MRSFSFTTAMQLEPVVLVFLALPPTFSLAVSAQAAVHMLPRSLWHPTAAPSMRADSSLMDDLADEAARRETLAKEAAAKVPAEANDATPLQDLLSVDVDLSLSLNEADAREIEAEADAIFRVIDSDGDGAITMSELREHLSGSGVSLASLTRMFQSLDANRDGVLTLRELCDGFKRFESSTLRLALGLAIEEELSDLVDPSRGPIKLQRADRQLLCDELFDRIDTNADGVISQDELRSHLVKTRGYSVATVDGIFRALDVAPRDGSLSREELRRSFGGYELMALRLALGLKHDVQGGRPAFWDIDPDGVF